MYCSSSMSQTSCPVPARVSIRPLPWVIEIAQRGIEDAAHALRPIARAVNMFAGEVTNRPVAETFAIPYSNRFLP